MKKNIIIIFLLSIVLAFTYTNYKINKNNKIYNIKNITKINGENENWELRDGIIIISDKKQYVDGGQLIYKGENQLIYDKLKIEINAENEKSKKVEYLLSFAEQSNKPWVIEKNHVLDSGLIEGDIFRVDNINDWQFFAQVSYTSSRVNKKERINLISKNVEINSSKTDGWNILNKKP